jgi:hypothetical protein
VEFFKNSALQADSSSCGLACLINWTKILQDCTSTQNLFPLIGENVDTYINLLSAQASSAGDANNYVSELQVFCRFTILVLTVEEICLNWFVYI